MENNNKIFGSPEIARMVIDEVGVKELMEMSQRSKPTIYRWRKTGLPRFLEMLLRHNQPFLKAWRV